MSNLTRGLTAVAVGAAALSLGGCGVGCDLIVEPALSIEIVDAQTGAWIADSASGWARREGGPAEPLRVAAWQVGTTGVTFTHLGAEGTGGGEYAVHVERDGYLSWDRDQIQVKSGSCGVETTTVKAALEPL